MKEDRIIADEPIELDPSELLGFSQVAKVSGAQGKPDDLGRLLSKIGNGEFPENSPAKREWGHLARLLSKIGAGGETPND